MAQPGRPENPAECTPAGEPYRGSLIRELRWKKELSRKGMAKLLDCDPDSLSKVETNGVNPSPQMLSKIAKLLEVPLEQLEQAPVHPRILRKKAASTSTAFRTPVAIKRQKILMHRLEIAEKKFHAAAKFLNELYEELCEIKALVTDTQSEEEDRADASSIGSV